MGVNIKGLKKYIFNNKLVDELLESLDVQNVHVEQSGNLIVGGLPSRFNSSNRRAVQVKYNQSLTCYIRNRSDFKGDIINLVSYLEFDARTDSEYSQTLSKTLTFITKTLNIKGLTIDDEVERVDYASPLKNLLNKVKRQNVAKLNPPIPEDILENYHNIFPLQWIEEGIDWETLDVFGIRIDADTNRAIIPIRNKRGQLIGTKGRLLSTEKETNEPKYLYLDRCNTSQELFNLHRAKESIQAEGYVYVFEGEKSTMKMWQEGYKNAVAIASSSFSDEQYRLIHELGDDIQIVLCYDNDKEISEIKEEVEKLSLELLPYHEIHVVYDMQELLPPKSSPIDGGAEILEQLLEENVYQIN